MGAAAYLNRLNNAHGFDPSKDIPDLSDKVILITGGNQGVGQASVRIIAKIAQPKRLYLAARSKAKYDAAVEEIEKEIPSAGSKITFLELDLASFDSIKRAAAQVVAENTRLDVLMNNAGIMGQPPGLTEQGYEMHFGTNHMGHALLTKLLLPLLQRTSTLPDSDVRIIDVTSSGHAVASGPTGIPIPFDGLNTENVTVPVKTTMNSSHSYMRYGASKMANIMHARELARRYSSIVSVSVHPGRVATNLLTDFFGTHAWYRPTKMFQTAYDWLVGTLSPEQGALNQLWAAFGKRDQVISGTYYIPVGYDDGCDTRAKNDEVCRKLWEWQEIEFQKYGF